MIDLSVIIVNFNVKEFLENAIISIKNATRRLKVEIFVVDNGSEDGSCNMVKNKFPDVKLIENKINLGFSKANNIALKLCKGKYVALINPDTIVQEDTFEKLISFMNSSNDIGMAGCKVLNPDGSLQLACRRSFPTPLVAFSRVVGLSKIFPKSRIWGKYNLTYLNPDKITEVDAISGSFMMIKKEVLNKVGLLDESYFLYGEDLDLCYRIKKEGYKIYYYPGTSIIHFKGESTKKTTYEPLKAFYKAMVIFIESHFKGKYLFLPLWLLKAGIHIKEVISLIIKNKTRAFSFILDLIFINVSILLALIIRFGKLVPLPVFFDIRSYFLINSVCSSIWLTLLYFNRIYTRYKFSRLTLSILEGFFVISTITFFFKEYAFSRLVVLYSVVLIFLFLTGWRFLEKLIRKIFTGKSFKMKRAV
ncbi:glycosyl transferase, partial [candidate division KSB1 bacterium]